MGCNVSVHMSSIAENRTEELGKCFTFSSEVRWSWLRGRTSFTFAELRNLLKLFQGAISKSLDSPSGRTAPMSTTGETRAPSYSLSGSGCDIDAASILGKGQGLLGTMTKAQFLTVCEWDEALRLSVGAFSSRLFDVLDEDGDGRLGFEDFATGLSKLLKGSEGEKLKLMYAAYDVSGVVPSEERSKSICGIKAPRRSKYLTVEDITTVLANASLSAAYPTLIGFMAGGGRNACLSGAGCPEPSGRRVQSGGVDGSPKVKGARRERGAGPVGAGRSPEALTEVFRELAWRNAALQAENIVSEYGQVQEGTLTQKEFERWALTGPVMRCQINEFSIDVNITPFQGTCLF